MAKDETYKRLIHTMRWVKLRRTVLGSAPLCERCMKEGRVTAATEVHHIRPVEEGATKREKECLMFDIFNLRALCHDCHVQTHTEMGGCGREQTKRRNAARSESFRMRFFAFGDASEEAQRGTKADADNSGHGLP